jgi:hypothetical protein
MSETTLELFSTLTCPKCGEKSKEKMPTDSCQYYYECSFCGVLLKPKIGDCCVYCSYGDIPCPPIQQEKGCCE